MDYQLKLVTAPTKEPWNVGGTVKELDIIQHGHYDAAMPDTEKKYLEGLIRAARIWAEDFTSRKFITQTWDLLLPNGFPGEIRIPRAPVSSITSVKYIDTNGTQITNYTTGATTWIALTRGEPAIVMPAYGVNWPSVRCHPDASGNYPVEVRFVAGYGADGTSVPQPFRQAIALLVAHWFNNREAVSEVPLSELPTYGVESLLWMDRFFPR